jgi:acetyl-CoA C-acetyltransferase
MDAYIYDAVRTPRGRGKKNGSLNETRSIELVVTVLEELRRRYSLDTAEVEDVILGCVTPVGEQGGNIAKAAAMYAGWDDRVSGLQINRFCASGLEAVNLAAMKVRSGWSDLLVAGGVESMGRVPMGTDGGALMFDPEVNARTGFVPQGISADLIATRQGYSREQLDRYALRSQRLAGAAQSNGRFDRSVVPVRDMNGLAVLDKDEYLRPDTTLEALSALEPSFAKLGAMGFDAVALRRYPELAGIRHLHTPGNSSGIVDGAAAVLIGGLEKGRSLGLVPRARIRAAALTSTEPTIMLQGPGPAAQKALRMASMTAADIDLWEMNEAFASAVLKFQEDLEVPDDRLNVNGGAIALGHPLGATGAMLLGTLLDELELRGLQTGLVTLCVGGGMGVATIIERC